jgi:hypothetical protein
MINSRRFIIGSTLLLSVTAAWAQAPAAFQPVIRGPTDVAVGRTVILDGSSSVVMTEEAEYRWYREGVSQPISRSVEAVYTPEEPGIAVFRLVISGSVNDEPVETEATHTVTVYDRKITLIADAAVPKEKLRVHQDIADDQGVFLRVLRPRETGLPIGEESSLQALISEQIDALAGAESIVIWTDGVTGLRSLLGALEGDETRRQLLQNQTVVLLTEQGLATIARTARGPFSVLRPMRIIVTRTEALNQLASSADVSAFLTALDAADIDFTVVDESTLSVRPWNVISSLVNYMLVNGVPSRTVVFLLMLPVIATILAFLKQVVGVTTFGLYTPSIIALSFLALGWVGVPFLIFILVTGYATRSLMRRWRLLYIPKVAIILTAVSLTLLVLLGIGAFFDLTLTSGDTIFILLIMSTLSETLLNVRAEQGLYSAVLGVVETILAALLCVFIVQWSVLQSLVLAYPELILLTVPINAFLGRWTGLRLVEYFRFREVFRHVEE